jgi:hypothetical protein
MFFRREYPRLVTLAYALSGSRELAEDAAQQAFGGYEVGPLGLPTFLALGRYDYVIPFYLWDRSKQHLSNLRYKLYEKRGHHPPYEQPPNACCAASSASSRDPLSAYARVTSRGYSRRKNMSKDSTVMRRTDGPSSSGRGPTSIALPLLTPAERTSGRVRFT